MESCCQGSIHRFQQGDPSKPSKDYRFVLKVSKTQHHLSHLFQSFLFRIKAPYHHLKLDIQTFCLTMTSRQNPSGEGWQTPFARVKTLISKIQDEEQLPKTQASQ